MPHSDSHEFRAREVAHRHHGPVEVTLLWNPDSSTATVVVWNWSSATCLRMRVEPELARYAFVHPYAYAAASGVDGRVVQQAA
jgi:hypothetical protein